MLLPVRGTPVLLSLKSLKLIDVFTDGCPDAMRENNLLCGQILRKDFSKYTINFAEKICLVYRFASSGSPCRSPHTLVFPSEPDGLILKRGAKSRL